MQRRRRSRNLAPFLAEVTGSSDRIPDDLLPMWHCSAAVRHAASQWACRPVLNRKTGDLARCLQRALVVDPAPPSESSRLAPWCCRRPARRRRLLRRLQSSHGLAPPHQAGPRPPLQRHRRSRNLAPSLALHSPGPPPPLTDLAPWSSSSCRCCGLLLCSPAWSRSALLQPKNPNSTFRLRSPRTDKLLLRCFRTTPLPPR